MPLKGWTAQTRRPQAHRWDHRTKMSSIAAAPAARLAATAACPGSYMRIANSGAGAVWLTGTVVGGIGTTGGGAMEGMIICGGTMDGGNGLNDAGGSRSNVPYSSAPPKNTLCWSLMTASPGATIEIAWPPSEGSTNDGTMPIVTPWMGIDAPAGSATFCPAIVSPPTVVATDHLRPFVVPS